MAREGFSAKEKELMLLARETRIVITITGIHIRVYLKTLLIFLLAVKSFVELVRYIFTIPEVKMFLSERLSQDPLKNFFGCQRQRRGCT